MNSPARLEVVSGSCWTWLKLKTLWIICKALNAHFSLPFPLVSALLHISSIPCFRSLGNSLYSSIPKQLIANSITPLSAFLWETFPNSAHSDWARSPGYISLISTITITFCCNLINCKFCKGRNYVCSFVIVPTVLRTFCCTCVLNKHITKNQVTYKIMKKTKIMVNASLRHNHY